MFILYALALGLVVGRLAGGRFDRVAAIRLRWAPVAVAGFAAQLALFSSLGASLPDGIGPVLYVASTGAVLAVVLRNAKLGGFPLIALGTLGVVGYAEIVLHLSPIEAPLTVPWPVLAVAFFLAESKVIVVAFRQETHSFSLSELPAVVGLFFVDPPSYVVAMVAGTLV